MAVQTGNTSIMTTLLSHPYIDVAAENRKGLRAQDVAALAGNSDAFKALVASPRVDINELNDLGETTLHLAAEFGNVDAAKIIIDSCRDVDVYVVSEDSGRTALQVAEKMARKRKFSHAMREAYRQVASVIRML